MSPNLVYCPLAVTLKDSQFTKRYFKEAVVSLSFLTHDIDTTDSTEPSHLPCIILIYCLLRSLNSEGTEGCIFFLYAYILLL